MGWDLQVCDLDDNIDTPESDYILKGIDESPMLELLDENTDPDSNTEDFMIEGETKTADKKIDVLYIAKADEKNDTFDEWQLTERNISSSGDSSDNADGAGGRESRSIPQKSCYKKKPRGFRILQQNEEDDDDLSNNSEDDCELPSPAKKSCIDPKPCPMGSCQKLVTNIVRHLRLVHGMSRTKAKRVYAENAETCRQTTGIYTRPLKKCPICISRIQRLDQHLSKTHKLPSSEVHSILHKSRYDRSWNEEQGDRVDKGERVSLLQEALVSFKEWQESFSGGRKSSSVSDQYCRTVKILLWKLGIPNCMEQLKTLVKPGGYVDAKLKAGAKPGTLRAYICALRIFFLFLKGDEGERYGVTYKFADLAVQEVTNWMASLRPAISQRQHSYAEQEMLIIPTISKAMDHYWESEHFKKSSNLFCIFTLMVPISSSEFSLMRDSLIIQILIRNGQRSGTITNALTSELDAATEEDGGYILKVGYMISIVFHLPYLA